MNQNGPLSFITYSACGVVVIAIANVLKKIPKAFNDFLTPWGSTSHLLSEGEQTGGAYSLMFGTVVTAGTGHSDVEAIK